MSNSKDKDSNENKVVKDYKDTLNLPNTEFPMKANLSQREPEILKHWQSISLYQQLAIKGDDKPRFILTDGPPFANGPIHLGHAVNKIIKDMIIKAKILGGYYAPFVPGWDCHGLPIEHTVEKKFGKPGIKIDARTFRQKCREFAFSQIELQRDAFIRLGLLGDWKNPYMTMDPVYEANIVRSFAKIISNGHLHKGYKPVHWCIDCASALAEAEVEYQDKVSPQIDVCFPVADTVRFRAHFPKTSDAVQASVQSGHPIPICVVIWTTTPWTLPANEAVAVHPESSYASVECTVTDANNANNQKRFCIMATELVDNVMARLKITNFRVVETCQGSELENLMLHHPFYDRTVPMVLGEHVTMDAGTGCVHTAPAHGQDDYIVCEKYELPLQNPVGSDGCYISTTPLLAGVHVLKANDMIIDLLKEKNHLLHQGKLEHSYPHCWRHKTPLIFRATRQWFISMDQNGLRENALDAISKVQWIPSWGQARIEGLIADRPDWCISRQRTWGTPMGLFLHRETNDIHPRTPELLERVAEKIEKDSIDAWYEIDIEEFLGSEAKHYEKAMDTLDVWFDSGVMHYCVLEKRKELSFPADLCLEGSDQHRGWFNSMLMTSVAMHNHAPYKQVLTHGFTVDTHGRKMSKSLGNVIAPEKVIQTLGADVLRLWVSSVDYRAEIVVSDEIFKRTSDTYRRIRNTARFLLANLNGFDPNVNRVAFANMLVLDRFIVNRARQLQIEIIQAFEDYQFHVIYQKIHHFCSIELGSFYLDIIKDRQYTGKKEGLPRRSAQTALYYIIECLSRWIAPILSFTAEEIWQHMPGNRDSSVFLSKWFEELPAAIKEEMDETYWQQILEIRDAVNKALEEARSSNIIGSGLEAEVELYCEENLLTLLSQLGEELRFVLITSKAEIYPIIEASKGKTDMVETSIPGLKLKLSASQNAKCERCWHRRADVNLDPNYPGICSRCVENIAGEGEVRRYA